MNIFEWNENIPVTANNLNEMQNILNDNIENANDTGSGYIKYPDGTMVCYGTISGDSALSEYWSNFKKTADITINFPQEFYSVPSITLTGLGYGYISTFLTSTPTLTRATCAVIKAGNSTNTDYYISYIAVGKWK